MYSIVHITAISRPHKTRCGSYGVSIPLVICNGKIHWDTYLVTKALSPTCEACILLHWADPSKTHIIFNDKMCEHHTTQDLSPRLKVVVNNVR